MSLSYLVPPMEYVVRDIEGKTYGEGRSFLGCRGYSTRINAVAKMSPQHLFLGSFQTIVTLALQLGQHAVGTE